MSGFSFATLIKVAKDSGFAVIDAGPYLMEITKAKAAKTKDGSKDKITVTLKVVAGPHAGKASVVNDFVISPDNGRALFFFFKHMAAFGLDEAYFANPNSTLEKAAADLIGRRAIVEVIVDNWQGQDRNKVGDVKPPTDGPQSAPPIGGGPGGIPAAANNGNGNGNGNGAPAAPPATDTPAAPANVPAPSPATSNGDAAPTAVSTMPKAPF